LNIRKRKNFLFVKHIDPKPSLFPLQPHDLMLVDLAASSGKESMQN